MVSHDEWYYNRIVTYFLNIPLVLPPSPDKAHDVQPEHGAQKRQHRVIVLQFLRHVREHGVKVYAIRWHKELGAERGQVRAQTSGELGVRQGANLKPCLYYVYVFKPQLLNH